MKKILYLIICMPLMLLTACDVHEWPEIPESVKLHLRLNYETDMTEWLHQYDGESVIEQGLGNTYDNVQNSGQIRYIVRIYPVSEKQRIVPDYTQEFVFTKNISEGYDHEVTLDVLPGNYNIMVWSDLVKYGNDAPFHNTDNFGRIAYNGVHTGNTDYRDAYRGTGSLSLAAGIREHVPDTLDVAMQRPLAKFEFVTNDVAEFIEKASARIASKANENKTESTDGTQTKVVNIEDYRIVFHYTGFVGKEYSIYEDKPVGSYNPGETQFDGKIVRISPTEARIGFDYVMVNGSETSASVQIEVYDREGNRLSLTDKIEVPLKRSHHTILTGMFLMSEASGGVSINPKFDGNYNLTFP